MPHGMLTTGSFPRRGLVASSVCGLLLCLSLHIRAQDSTDVTALRIQILNGRTGRPITNQPLRLRRKGGQPLEGNTKTSETTDGEGYAPIPNVDTVIKEVSVFVEGFRPCSKTETHTFSLTKVRVAGVVSENACRPRITMYPQQGTLIFYVRDETFIEKMRH